MLVWHNQQLIMIIILLHTSQTVTNHKGSLYTEAMVAHIKSMGHKPLKSCCTCRLSLFLTLYMHVHKTLHKNLRNESVDKS